MQMRTDLLAILASLGATFGALWNGLDIMIQLLVVAMMLDYVSGFMIAVVFKRSPKTESGGANSNIGFKGLCKKAVMLAVIYLAYMLDMAMGVNMIQAGAIVAFLSNELLSIAENLGIMGVPYPEALHKAIDILQEKKA